MIIYDCIIVGSGPAGLTFATLADKNEKIMIIEKDNFIGGCHKVNRQIYENEYYFCEHGPRVYINNYVNFKMILNKIGLKFNDLFKRNKLTTFELLNKDISKKYYNTNEIFSIIKAFFSLLLDPNYAKNISMYNFLISNNFTEKAINYTNRYCKIIDGGDINKMSLNTFLHIIYFYFWDDTIKYLLLFVS